MVQVLLIFSFVKVFNAMIMEHLFERILIRINGSNDFYWFEILCLIVEDIIFVVLAIKAWKGQEILILPKLVNVIEQGTDDDQAIAGAVCPNCGNPISNEMDFCINCGHKIER